MTESKMRLPHILYFSTLRNWIRLMWRYGNQVDRGHWLQVCCITMFVVATVPIRLLERLLFGLVIHRHQLREPPVFIIGHWRSGTTHLHNILLQDAQFASVTMLHCAIPSGFLTWGWLARLILRRRLPASRPMDAVPLGIDEPMSEDFALTGLTHMSHYLNYFFPTIAEETFRQTVLFEHVTSKDIGHWSGMYNFLLKKVSWASGGRRLLLKNPPNLGRVPEVLRHYPDAKFIHVFRDPYVVHASTVRLMERFTANLSFQGCTGEQIEQFVSRRQKLIFDRWNRDRALIPSGNLIELRHEDIVEKPLESAAAVYQRFMPDRWEAVRERIRSYTASLAGYRTNEYQFDQSYLLRISAWVNPIADSLGYPRRDAVTDESDS